MWIQHQGLAQSRTTSVDVGRAVETPCQGSFCPDMPPSCSRAGARHYVRQQCAFSPRVGTSLPAPCGNRSRSCGVKAVRSLGSVCRERWGYGWTWSPPPRPLGPPVSGSKRPVAPRLPESLTAVLTCSHLVCEMKARLHA